ncbi:virulence-associated E family protein [Psychromarinibacter sp. C21-152]|uniref:Virulence-associated E family protein n=1 Tax=Psychromarinibacter sediminicola TaxID=3033385 RepID=A0AAE3NZB7_9RHOB|nr:virulence-associated E family protein [Psychromarinibacter sediminicola]MDF0603675.1 virulence-associated E family protein [Psychromarinibacter sediminicola]
MSGDNDFHKLRISTGKHRGKVKNVEIIWKRFCEKFAEPSVDQTTTYGQYMKLSVDEKGAKKAAPGYIVGAWFEDGKRRLTHMKKRHLISFDLDEVTAAQMDEIEMGLSLICDYEFLRHTTRAHCPESPRWRIHMPISRPVDHDEANAITRILATMLFSDPQESIDAVDVVSHRYAQVSYMPSRSKNQEYRVERNEGKVLDVDALLENFDGDWQDHTQLPMRSDETTARGADPDRKMERPDEKPGIIGAWCRTYTVDEVIQEFLSDVYEPGFSSDGHPRYTYLLGTGANGAVSYDDGLFLYSNHGSDPIEGAANAWDLARIHLYGHLDRDAREDTSPGNLPSYKAMVQFAGKDDAVRDELLAGRRAQFDDTFDDEDEDEQPSEKPNKSKSIDSGASDSDCNDETQEDSLADRFDDDENEDDEIDLSDLMDEPEEKPKKKKKAKPKKWRNRLKANLETGAILKSLHNINLILQNDPGLAGTISYNLFTRKVVTRKEIGFPNLDLSRVPIEDPFNGREWLDADDHDRKLVLSAPEDQGGYDMDAAQIDIAAAVETAARRNPFHPIREKLESVEWDGVERAETLFIDYLGIPDDAYGRETARAWLLAAVTRVYEPGAKFDFVPIIGGSQGKRKSSFIKVLAWDYFGELSAAFDNLQKMVESMSGSWIMEVPELAGFRKSEVETVKQFFSACWDRVRLAFRRNEETFYRQCVFIGTTNKEEYLKDETGNRRFWPLKAQVDLIDTDKLRREIGQVWAEVVTWYRKAREEQPHGELFIDLVSDQAKQTARDLQEESRTTLPFEIIAERLQEWLDKPCSQAVAEGADTGQFDDEDDGEAQGRRIRVSVDDAWRDGLGKVNDPSPLDLQNLNSAVRALEGWTVERRKIGGKRTRWLLRDGAAWDRAVWEPL